MTDKTYQNCKNIVRQYRLLTRRSSISVERMQREIDIDTESIRSFTLLNGITFSNAIVFDTYVLNKFVHFYFAPKIKELKFVPVAGIEDRIKFINSHIRKHEQEFLPRKIDSQIWIKELDSYNHCNICELPKHMRVKFAKSHRWTKEFQELLFGEVIA